MTALLPHKKVILASGSPRRFELLKQLNIPFKVRLKEVDEAYPKHLQAEEITQFLATLKANAFTNELKKEEILITADTMVWHKNKALGKPKTKEEAIKILQQLSDSTHDVITSVCVKSTEKEVVFSEVTKVTFKKLLDEEILFYIDNYQPFDKAGSYGIQEWIGYIGITKIEGSYFNVMGLPTQKLYDILTRF